MELGAEAAGVLHAEEPGVQVEHAQSSGLRRRLAREDALFVQVIEVAARRVVGERHDAAGDEARDDRRDEEREAPAVLLADVRDLCSNVSGALTRSIAQRARSPPRTRGSSALRPHASRNTLPGQEDRRGFDARINYVSRDPRVPQTNGSDLRKCALSLKSTTHAASTSARRASAL